MRTRKYREIPQKLGHRAVGRLLAFAIRENMSTREILFKHRMRNLTAASALIMAALCSGQQKKPLALPAAPIDIRTSLEDYCVICHNNGMLSGGLALDTLDPPYMYAKP